MLVSHVACVCPACDEQIELRLDDITEMEVVDGIAYVTFSCPRCRSAYRHEELEPDY